MPRNGYKDVKTFSHCAAVSRDAPRVPSAGLLRDRAACIKTGSDYINTRISAYTIIYVYTRTARVSCILSVHFVRKRVVERNKNVFFREDLPDTPPHPKKKKTVVKSK